MRSLSKLFSALPLITSYLTGQGSIFLVNTLFASRSEFDKVWGFGVCLSILAVANGIVDWSTTATAPRDGLGSKEKSFIENSNILRLLICIPMSILLIAVSFYITNPFIKGFVQILPFSIVLNAINLTGILDGPGRPVLQKFLQGFPYVGATLTIFITSSFEPFQSGIATGTGLFFGTFINILFQYLSIKRKVFFSSALVDVASVARRFHAGWRIMVSFIVSQGGALCIMILAGVAFGSSSGGILIYVRSLIVASVQIAVLIRRVEIHQYEEWNDNFKIRSIVGKYPITTATAILFPVFASIAYYCFVLIELIQPQEIYFISLLAYLAIVPMAIFTTVLNSELVLRKQGANLWIFDIILNLLCVAAFSIFSWRFGYISFFLVDVLLFALRATFLLLIVIG